MKIIYIAHPIGGDVEANIADLKRIIRIINLTKDDVVPFCPYMADVLSMDDSIVSERKRGIRNDIEILCSGIVKELWLTGPRISEGMLHEKWIAEKEGIPVVDFINHF